MILSPSLLSADCSKLGQELTALEHAGLHWVHWDVMDGRFVPNITFGQHVIKQVRAQSSLIFDVHLMIEEPQNYIEDFKQAGADILVVHVEATKHLQRTLAEIRRLGMKPGVALNPATPLETLDYILDDIDMVLLMSVNPGFGGQSFIPASLKKISTLRQKLDAHKSGLFIEVDGGVNLDNASVLTKAGADVLVSGSAFFGQKSYKEARLAFEQAASP